MAYLSDLLAREYLGEPITEFRYYRYDYGPYDDAVLDFIDELVSAGLAEVRETYEHDAPTKRLYDFGKPVAFTFGLGEQEVLRYVTKNYLDMALQELLVDVVYQTPPMLAAIDKDPRDKFALGMDDQNDVGTKLVGFKLEDVLRAEQEESFDDFAMAAN
jgi:hypothetical protein